jgi:hypothetical protein
VLAYSKHPFLFFVGSLPYELMRTLKLFLLDPFLLLRALSKVFLSFRQRAHAG